MRRTETVTVKYDRQKSWGETPGLLQAGGTILIVMESPELAAAHTHCPTTAVSSPLPPRSRYLSLSKLFRHLRPVDAMQLRRLPNAKRRRVHERRRPVHDRQWRVNE